MYVYNTVVLVPGDPLRSYRGKPSNIYIYIILQLVFGDPLPNYRGHLN
jgi:hypothetical protein